MSKADDARAARITRQLADQAKAAAAAAVRAAAEAKRAKPDTHRVDRKILRGGGGG